MIDVDRNASRQYFQACYLKWLHKLPLEPLESQIVDVIESHPEYHPFLADEKYIDESFASEGSVSNPFFHLSLHLAIREQISTNRPQGIKAIFEKWLKHLDDGHAAEHKLITVLGDYLWETLQSGSPPNDHVYLEKLNQL